MVGDMGPSPLPCSRAHRSGCRLPLPVLGRPHCTTLIRNCVLPVIGKGSILKSTRSCEMRSTLKHYVASSAADLSTLNLISLKNSLQKMEVLAKMVPQEISNQIHGEN